MHGGRVHSLWPAELFPELLLSSDLRIDYDAYVPAEEVPFSFTPDPIVIKGVLPEEPAHLVLPAEVSHLTLPEELFHGQVPREPAHFAALEEVTHLKIRRR